MMMNLLLIIIQMILVKKLYQLVATIFAAILCCQKLVPGESLCTPDFTIASLHDRSYERVATGLIASRKTTKESHITAN